MNIKNNSNIYTLVIVCVIRIQKCDDNIIRAKE